jgi:hypothetical protein
MSLDLDDFDAPVVEVQVAKPDGPVAPSAAASTSAAPAVAVAPPSPSSTFSQAVAIAKTESKKAVSQFGKEYGADIKGALNPIYYNEQGPQDYTNIDWALTLPHAAVEAGVGYGLAKRGARMMSGQSSAEKEASRQYAEQNKLAREKFEYQKLQDARQLKLAQAAQTAQQAPVPVKPTPILKMGPMSLATAVGGAPGGAPGAPFTAPPPAQSAPPVGQAPAAVAPTAAPDLPPTLAPTEPTSPFSPPARVADVPATTVDVAREIGPAVDTPDKVAAIGQQTTTPVAEEFNRYMNIGATPAAGVAPTEEPPKPAAETKKTGGRPTKQAVAAEMKGKVFKEGFGGADNYLEKQMGPDIRRFMKDEFNQGKPYGGGQAAMDKAYADIKKYDTWLKENIPVQTLNREERKAMGVPPPKDYPVLGKAMKVGGAAGLLMTAGQAANAREAMGNVAEALLPLGMTPSELAPGTLTKKQLDAYKEAQKLGSPYRSVPPR